MDKPITFAVIGCGLIGKRRAHSLDPHRLVMCADLSLERAQQLAREFKNCRGVIDSDEVLASPEVEAVVIATPHASLARLTRIAIENGKHVLVEKPAALGAGELTGLSELAEHNKVKVHVGFNHRYHRAFQRAREIIDAGTLGSLMHLRARYGHGGRVGYEKEWRANPTLSGGGELIDQGVHLIDLARWFLGDFTRVDGHAVTSYWQMSVDDNAFLLLRTAQNQTAFLHASCTEWKNTFSFEMYGKLGKLQIDGLGGSYGVERLSWYRMLPEMGPPETTIWEFPLADNSWRVETSEFIDDILYDRRPSVGISDAQAALEIVAGIYKSSGYDYHS